jgi:hypothetical protein
MKCSLHFLFGGGKGSTLGDFSNEASRSCILYSKNSASASYHKNKMLAHSINQVTELGMVKFSDGTKQNPLHVFKLQ